MIDTHMLLNELPESLQVYLWTEWIDLERDGRTVADVVPFVHLVTQLRTPQVLSEACVAWLLAQHVVLREWAEVDRVGTQRWFRHGRRLHRDGDLPAVVRADGTQEWFQHGLAHRDGDLPAFSASEDAIQVWYRNGREHRDGDRPAYVLGDGSRAWFRHGQLHRDGGLPAVIHQDGEEEWWVHDVRQA